MDKETFNDICDNELMPKEKEIIPDFLQGLSNQQIANKFFLHPATISKRITSIRQKLALAELKNQGKLPKQKGNEEWKTILKIEIEKIDKEQLVKYFSEYTQLSIAYDVLEKYGIATGIPYPEGAEEVNSPWYLEQDQVKNLSRNTLNKLGSLLKIKAPKEMGKTSLINKLFDYTHNNNYVIYFSLNSLDTNTLSDYSKFLFTFCEIITEELSDVEDLKLDLASWNLDNDLNVQCTKFFKQILQQLQQPLVLILDDLERIFEYQSTYKSFFPLLRNWHEKGKNRNLNLSKIQNIR